MRRKRLLLVRKAVALFVATALAGPALAANGASLSGRVLSLSDGSPVAGATVHAASCATAEIRSSLPSGPDGRFEISELAARSYLLAVESRGGLHVVASPLALETGDAREIQLALVQAAGAPGSSGESPPSAKTSRNVWENPLTATLIVVGAAIVVGAILGSSTPDTTPASVSEP